MIQFFTNSEIVSNFANDKNQIFDSLILDLMRARLVSHHMLGLLFVLRSLYNERLFEVLQVMSTKLIEALSNL